MDRNRSGARQQIVIAGAGYAGLHVALRLAAWDDSHITCTVGARSRHRVKGHATGCLLSFNDGASPSNGALSGAL